MVRRSLAALGAALALSPLARAADPAPIPMLVNHQGRLLAEGDQPAQGSVDLVFQLHETADGTVKSPVWTETWPAVALAQGGSYAVVLGSKTALTSDLLNKPQLFLSVTVGSSELLPRQRLTSALYALRAQTAVLADRAKASADSEKLGGEAPSFYAKAGDLTALQTATAQTYVTKSDADAKYLDKTGDAEIAGKLTTGALTAGGNVDVAGNLSAGDLKVNGIEAAGDVTVASGKKITTPALATGTLTATGALSGASLAVSGAAAVSGNLTVTGTTTTGATTVNGNLTVTGTITSSGQLSGNGAGLTGVDAAKFGGQAPTAYVKYADGDATDDFSTLNGTRWSVVGGSWAVNGEGKLQLTPGTSQTSGHVASTGSSGLPTSPDVVVEADVSWTNQLDAGLYFRMGGGAGAMWLFRDRNNGTLDNYVTLSNGVGNLGTVLCQTPHAQISDGNWTGLARVKLVVRGPAMDGYINGVHTIHCADSRLPQNGGGVGLYAFGGVGAQAFDNLRVRTAPMPVSPSEMKGEMVLSQHYFGAGYITVAFRPCFTETPRAVCVESGSATNFNVCKFDTLDRCGGSMAVASVAGAAPPARGWDVIAVGK